MKNNIQNFLSEMGKSGCYALCLISVAEDYLKSNGINDDINIVKSTINAIQKNYIKYNWDDKNDPDNMWVEYPALFLELLTNKKWSVVKRPAEEKVNNKTTFKINYYELRLTNKIQGHFDRDNFHPIENSNTIKYGELHSTRICEVIC